MFSDNKNFYPTPKSLITKMIAKVEGYPSYILEPSAGRGDIVESLKDCRGYGRRYESISCIEKDQNLRFILQGKSFTVIDDDFLTFSGVDKFDLIIANPPFDNGDKHLLKAIDIMYNGQIIFIINAETLKNPYSQSRKDLVEKLELYDADIEFLQSEFGDADRKTQVEVALISLSINNSVEEDLFNNCDEIKDETIEIKENHEVTTQKSIEQYVAEYNQVVTNCTDTIIEYYKNYNKVSKYIKLQFLPSEEFAVKDSVTKELQESVNLTLLNIRKNFWYKVLTLTDVKKRMTEVKLKAFEETLSKNALMDFTTSNIRQFILNLMDGYEDNLAQTTLDLFDTMTIENSYRDTLYEKNIHLFNGWKTNNAFKVGKKVIIPISASYGNPFLGYNGWSLDYKAARTLDDIDIVMNYFDTRLEYVPMSETIKKAFLEGESKNIESTYFTITTYKKGTIHLTFKDEDILRRFNVVACKRKNWLPDEFGETRFENLTIEDQNVVKSFEGKSSYNKNIQIPNFPNKNLKMIA